MRRNTPAIPRHSLFPPFPLPSFSQSTPAIFLRILKTKILRYFIFLMKKTIRVSNILKKRALAVLAVGIGCMLHTNAVAQAASVTKGNTPAKTIKMPTLPATFKHPGLLHSTEELAFIKKKIQAGEEPWASAFEQMKTSPWAALNYKPKPHVSISSGFLGAGAKEGGVADASHDSKTAYTQALMWVFTGNEQYVRNAANILTAWSILRENRGGNWYIQGAWTATMFTNAAEIVRYTWDGWKQEDIDKFSTMLNEAFLPILHNRMSYGNRLLSVSQAMISIGVFNEDRAAVTEALQRWVSYVPCWIYLESDGKKPIVPDYWLTGPSNEELAQMDKGMRLLPDVSNSWIFRDTEILAKMKQFKLGDDSSSYKDANLNTHFITRHWNKAPEEAFIDGLSGEIFRDLGHADLGFSSLAGVAEVAWHQGIDLYGLEAKRIVAGVELLSSLRIDEVIPPAFYRIRGTPIQSSMDLIYNHYRNRMGVEMPKTLAFMKKAVRPSLKKEVNGAPGWCWVPVELGVRAENVVWPISSNIAWELLLHADQTGLSTGAKR